MPSFDHHYHKTSCDTLLSELEGVRYQVSVFKEDVRTIRAIWADRAAVNAERRYLAPIEAYQNGAIQSFSDQIDNADVCQQLFQQLHDLLLICYADEEQCVDTQASIILKKTLGMQSQKSGLQFEKDYLDNRHLFQETLSATHTHIEPI
ncbi:hypothetical protein AB733_15455 [Photobacterium swingsii]|uniref:Uncharacterized protein n=1 Tax=Photobacterium swingsii TaxID=680026 RepID=A0A0J8V9Q4_9GAMM|nr:hypothetical protein [Photobacterium swingsii]KMV29887.1 hypothetical protein AB733_15455 [Photobacterium swingsii]PSW26025.1 hypothetical protein C9I94_05605 [Photobacterium swingsii]